MPRIFEQDGNVFIFYSSEHLPIHVHVTHGEGEAVFNVEDGVVLRESVGMKVRRIGESTNACRRAPKPYSGKVA